MTEVIQCFFSPSRRVLIDTLRPDGTASLTGEDLQAVRLRYPDAVQMTVDEVCELKANDGVDEEVTPCTREEFTKAFEIFEPYRWRTDGDTESFMSPDHLNGLVTEIHVRLGADHYTFNDKCTLSHQQIVAKTRSSVQRLSKR